MQRQLNAYNARNIDAFLDGYADDIEIYDLHSNQPEKGKELTDVPADLDQTFSAVHSALSELQQTMAQLGMTTAS